MNRGAATRPDLLHPAGDAGRIAFVDSLGEVLLVGSVLALAAAVVAALWIRGRDLHPSATSGSGASG